MPATRDDAAEGINALYARHYLALVRLARHLVDDLESAEDVVQDVFAGLSRRPPPHDPIRYLQTAVVNRSRSMLRRRMVSRAFAARASLIEISEAADENTLRTDRRRSVLVAISALPRRQREVVVLRYYEDLGVAEIAVVLGITAGAVSSSLSRALDTLQTQIGNVDDH